ncbi:hypothetical protein RQP46_006222 [Phenoliferia psychrophenolica]
MRISPTHPLAATAATLLLLPTLTLGSTLDLTKGTINSAPKGYGEWTSPNVLPSPNITGYGNWTAAVIKARAFVADLTIAELVNLTTGQGQESACVGNTGTIPRKSFTGICLQDSPTGGVNVFLGPMMNLVKNVAAGRNWEGAGADPYLSGIVSAETVKGVQSAGVIACAKEHFRGGSGAQAESSNIDDRTLHELYTYSCENSYLLNGVLKGELGFQGFVTSDWGAVESGVNTALAGTDMNMPGFKAYAVSGADANETNPSIAKESYWGASLVEYIKNGSVPLVRVQDMATRTMAAYYMMGQDQDFPETNFHQLTMDTYLDGVLVNQHVDVQSNHSIGIRATGAASVVLLKNVNSTLPLAPTDFKKFGIFGSDSGPISEGLNPCAYRACDVSGTLAMGWGSGSQSFTYLVDPLSAIQSYVRANGNPTAAIEYVLDDYNYDNLEAVARRSEVCLAFVSADSGEAVGIVDGNAGDRQNLTLWHSGDKLIKKVASECANTVVVMHTAGAVLMESWVDHPNVTAILYAGLPGQESGNSLVDVVFGAVNPSGRLVQTIAKERSDYGSDVLYHNSSDLPIPQIVYKEKLLIDHRWLDAKNITPRFEFGFGLSYTTFSYGNLTTTSSSTTSRRSFVEIDARSDTPVASSSLADVAYTVSFAVTNTGTVDGHEVSQLYLGFPEGAGEPPKVLRGFERTFISAGATERVVLELTKKDISIWDVASASWTIPSGTFTVFIGQSSRLITLTGSFDE